MAHSNKLITSDLIVNEGLDIIGEKLNFVNNVERNYDTKFAGNGNTIDVRLRNRFEVGSDANISSDEGNLVNTSTPLTINKRSTIKMDFTAAELAMDIKDFSELYITPAIEDLAAKVESLALVEACKAIPNVSTSSAVTLAELSAGRKILQDNRAPSGNRFALLDSQGSLDYITDTKGLYSDPSQREKGYREGFIGRVAGFDVMENTSIPAHTTGAEDGAYLVAGADQDKDLSSADSNPNNQSLNVDTGTGTIKAGDVFTIANVNGVNPVTGSSTGLKQFVVTADSAGGTVTLAISPAIIASGPYQNVDAAPANDAAIEFVGTDSTADVYNQSVLFQKGFAAFGTVELIKPNGVDMASSKSYQGISLRFVRQYDVKTDALVSRLDLAWGFKVVRPELAVRLLHT